MDFGLKEICAGQGGGITVTAVARKEEESTRRRRRSLRRVDMELEKGNFKAASTLVKQLQDKQGGLRGFASAKLVANELMVNRAECLSIVSEVNSVLQSIQSSRQAWEEEEEEQVRDREHHFDILQVSGAGKGTYENGDCYNSILKDRAICLQHEAGHFLIGYLLGVLPKRYKIPTIQDLLTDIFAGGNIEFHTFDFLSEVYTSRLNCTITLKKNKENRRIVSSKTLNRFLCVILGGLVAEQLQFGHSELQHSDIEKLDRVLIWLGYNETEANYKIKLAAINSILILRQYLEVTKSLAETMSLGKSVGCCIDTIERTL